MLRILFCAMLFALPSLSNATTLCGNYDAVTLSDYRINNNVWNDVAGSQCISYTSPSTQYTVSQSNHNKPTNGAPASYPFTLKGCHWGACTPNSNLPKTVGSIVSASTTWSTGVGYAGIYNKSYDLWFNTTPTAPGQPNAHEIMIWLFKQGAIQPIGSQIASNVSIDGAFWNVWTNGFVTSYVRTTNVDFVSNLNLKSFMTDALSRGKLNVAWYLVGIEAGFEIWQGGAGLVSRNFTATVQ